MLFENDNGDELSLHTAISELHPGQLLDGLKFACSTKKPSWDWSESMANNHPTLQHFDVKSSITECKWFLALKITKKDESSEQPVCTGCGQSPASPLGPPETGVSHSNVVAK